MSLILKNPGAETRSQYIVGVGLESMTTEMGADVQRVKDILGNNEIKVGGYEKASTISPYSCDSGDDIYDFLQDIIDNERTLDDLEVNVYDVKLFETPTGTAPNVTYPAVKETAIVEITSYDRTVAGYQINFNLLFKSDPVHGEYNPSTKAFVED